MSQLIEGNSLDVLKEFPDNYFSSCITDPPYELGFMGKKWDQSGIAYSQDLWSEVLRVLKPGAYLLSFGGTRTYHRMACAIEDMGFEIRDSIHWCYGSGFPKSANISIQCEKELCHKVGDEWRYIDDNELMKRSPPFRSEDANEWAGFGTALKPAHEPIVMARKPLEGRVIDNIRKWGCGGLNIDGSRITYQSESDKKGAVWGSKNPHPENESVFGYFANQEKNVLASPTGRFPANFILEKGESVRLLDQQSGISKSTGGRTVKRSGGTYVGGQGDNQKWFTTDDPGFGDTGTASRFFKQIDPDPFIYVAKASSSERAGCKHPTIKPLKLIKYLVTLITPPDGIVLDPFLGSGTTGIACNDFGFDWVGIDLDISFATERLNQNKKDLSKEKNILEWK